MRYPLVTGPHADITETLRESPEKSFVRPSLAPGRYFDLEKYFAIQVANLQKRD